MAFLFALNCCLTIIIQDKKSLVTRLPSEKMFGVEVAIMNNVIRYLNTEGAYVLYIYDALLCEDKDFDLVSKTMNRIILEHDIKTRIKS